jgi:hypothetical protein
MAATILPAKKGIVRADLSFDITPLDSGDDPPDKPGCDDIGGLN